MSLPRILLTAFVLALNVSAYAEVTVVRHFRLGETDPAAAHGEPAGSTSRDSSGVDDLVVTGAPVYSAAVANSASTLSMVFDGTTQYATTGNWDNLTTNFGVEVWVKPTTAEGEHYIVYNGDSSTNGWGIIQNPATGKFSGLFGGRSLFGQGNITPGVWTHLAIVCADTLATFYVNGVPSGTTTDLPLAATGFMAIGAKATTPARDLFGGNIDEVRIFTFAPGAFSTGDLLYNGPAVPPTLSLKATAGQDRLVWPTWDRGYGLQTSTTLLPGSWTSTYAPPEANGVFAVTQAATGPKRFYRLAKPCGEDLAPRLPEGKYVVITTGGVPKNVTNPTSQGANRIAGNTVSSFDASAFIDPADCNGGANSLVFHWAINYPGGVSGFSTVGLTGYRKAVLSAVPSSMVNQPNPFAAQGAGTQFLLTVTSRLTGKSTVMDIRAQIVSSQLTLTIYNDCKLRTQACATAQECLCTNPAGLPTAENTGPWILP